jgi:hypothetical protein
MPKCTKLYPILKTSMENIDTQNEQPLKLNKYIPGLHPEDLQVDYYLNLETESGSRYVFRVVSKDAEEGVVIEFVAGAKALEGSKGKLSSRKIELENILNFKGGSTSTLIGIVVTQGAPYEYPYVELEYNVLLEELDVGQLRIGDHIYFGTEDGQTYVVEVMDDEETPLIKFVAGRNSLVGSEDYLLIKNLVIGMKFRNTTKSTMPIQNMVVLPDMDENMLDILDKESKIQELEYEAEIEDFYVSQLQDGDFIHIETAGANNSTYVIAFNDSVIKIVGGKNKFVGEVGTFDRGKVSKDRRLKTTIVRTTKIKSIRVTKTYEPEGHGEVDLIRQSLEERQIAAVNCPANSMTNPVMWFGIESGIHKLEIFDALELNPGDLTIEALHRAWEKFRINNPDNHREILPSEYNKKLRRFRMLERQYEDLITKLERMNEILKEK